MINLCTRKGPEPNTKEVEAAFTFETDTALVHGANLGKTPQTCKLCNAAGNFQTWRVLEMFVGLREPFRYFECPLCQVLQIEKIPRDMTPYYAHEYYSYAPPQIQPVRPGAMRDTRMILDVGCGAGNWLCFLASIGLTNLYGCDPLIQKDLTYGNGVKIYKKTIHEMDGVYDVIHLSHALEHMADPRKVFKTFGRLLKHRSQQTGPEAPKIQITIPVFPNAAFDIYGPYWYQLDAPRHFFLHSEKSIAALATEYGFYVEQAEHTPHEGMFSKSRLYQLGVPFINSGEAMRGEAYFTATEKLQLEAAAQATAAARRADTVAFVLKRKE
jgi:SAM-dependent methyltransferase